MLITTVAAREEERRRIRRDLHDGMGPTLASVAQRIGLATALLPEDPERSARLLVELEGQVRGALGEIRRLVYALRPPALDQYGLVEAVRLEVEHVASPTLRIELHAPESLPTLPAAVETALYRIALEAVTNVVHHAGARSCLVRIERELLRPWLRLTVEDDGCGIAPRANTLQIRRQPHRGGRADHEYGSRMHQWAKPRMRPTNARMAYECSIRAFVGASAMRGRQRPGR